MIIRDNNIIIIVVNGSQWHRQWDALATLTVVGKHHFPSPNFMKISSLPLDRMLSTPWSGCCCCCCCWCCCCCCWLAAALLMGLWWVRSLSFCMKLDVPPPVWPCCWPSCGLLPRPKSGTTWASPLNSLPDVLCWPPAPPPPTPPPMIDDWPMPPPTPPSLPSLLSYGSPLSLASAADI